MSLDLINNILNNNNLDEESLTTLLQAEGEAQKLLFEQSAKTKKEHVGNVSYYRGLIEFSNICSKNCYYCGIRAGNTQSNRYEINEKALLEAVKFAHEHRFGSVVFQAGERSDKAFIEKVDRLLKRSKQLTNNEIGITISLGEQTEETYRRWFESGAHRYLLRIETTNEELYYKLHPRNAKHDFAQRMEALQTLQKTGYQTGTGVMIGLPFQTHTDLARDLLFFKSFDVDMVGMGPYIEHAETPLYNHRHLLLPLQKRFELALRMIAVLRLLMPDINIAAATALQAIDAVGREKALKIGANVIMPNITPTVHRSDYQLYQNKPCTDEGANDCTNCLEARIGLAGDTIGYGKWGDSKHFYKRQQHRQFAEE